MWSLVGYLVLILLSETLGYDDTKTIIKALNTEKIFPGHNYQADEEGSSDSHEDFSKHIQYHKEFYKKLSTKDRLAGDRLFVDGDTGSIDWNEITRNIIADFEANDPFTKYGEFSKAKNVILFVGNGMGPSTVSASRIYSMQTDQTRLAFDSFPALGISRTYATNAQVTEGSASATALLAGEKCKYGVLGLNQHVERGDCHSTMANRLESFWKKASKAGKWGGIVSTSRVTGPTTASAFATAADGAWETDTDRDAAVKKKDARSSCPDIASQLVDDHENANMRVILGGGRQSFLPNSQADPEYPEKVGKRSDGRDLIDEWVKQKHNEQVHYVWNKEEFGYVNPAETDYLMGLFEPSSMQYELDRDQDAYGEPSLPEMVEKAIKVLEKSPEGYFLLVSGGRINDAHRKNKAVKALSETATLSKAVRLAQELTREEDTLVIVTADHSNAMTLAGYPAINNDIAGLARINLGLLIPMLDLKPYTTLMYSTGPGFLNHRTNFNSSDPVEGILPINVKARKNLRENPDVGDKDFYHDAGMYRQEGSNGGEDVAVYAYGAMSRMFTGVFEQNYIAHAMMYASCVAPYADRQGCQGK